MIYRVCTTRDDYVFEVEAATHRQAIARVVAALAWPDDEQHVSEVLSTDDSGGNMTETCHVRASANRGVWLEFCERKEVQQNDGPDNAVRCIHTA